MRKCSHLIGRGGDGGGGSCTVKHFTCRSPACHRPMRCRDARFRPDAEDRVGTSGDRARRLAVLLVRSASSANCRFESNVVAALACTATPDITPYHLNTVQIHPDSVQTGLKQRLLTSELLEAAATYVAPSQQFCESTSAVQLPQFQEPCWIRV